ncbi:hypothetical protein ED733_005303 [Metarhizium rileyi]|uniref:Uncharacterized protein n=1 Tax=Metarhizium rileyi (strain RCEF 4871) TaxID=1649241 RepID=A0A5C6GNW6_METRR|nr:hypothetical protein ED733_005303 [Metarhizium rileyi]
MPAASAVCIPDHATLKDMRNNQAWMVLLASKYDVSLAALIVPGAAQRFLGTTRRRPSSKGYPLPVTSPSPGRPLLSPDFFNAIYDHDMQEEAYNESISQLSKGEYEDKRRPADTERADHAVRNRRWLRRFSGKLKDL